MKYCSHCGWELMDNAEICIHCGCQTDAKPIDRSEQDLRDTLSLVTRFFMLASLFSCIAVSVLCGIGVLICSISNIWVQADGLRIAIEILWIVFGCTLLPLCWIIPLTISVSRRLGNNKPIGIGTKVAVLIFVNIFAGIVLMFIKDPKENNQNQIKQ